MTETLSLIDRLVPSGAANTKTARNLLGMLRVAIPAIVRSFDAATQTVTVQPALRETMNLNGVQQNVEMGLIADVPVMVYRAGGYSVTLPIQEGDECLIVIADMCIDAWFQSGGVQTRIDGRRHSLSDAIAVFGLGSAPRQLAGYNTAAMQLRSDDGNTLVEVGAGVVTVKADTINVTGETVNVTGSTRVVIDGNDQTTIDGKNFLLHTHSGVTAGGGVTGPVVP